MGACNKDKEEDNNPTEPGAKVMFVNATVGADSVRAEALQPGGVSFQTGVALLANTGYLGIPAGINRTIQFRAASSNLPLGDTAVNLMADQAYTAFSIGTIQTQDLIFTTDNLSAPTGNRTKIRFVNASNQSFPATFTIQNAGSTTTLATGIAYKMLTGFSETNPGTVTINAISPVDLNVVSLPNVQLGEGKIYTVVLSGIPGGSGKNNLQLNLMSNN